ncbi:MAG: S8 family peptidase [Micromonosporaceae bacterium]
MLNERRRPGRGTAGKRRRKLALAVWLPAAPALLGGFLALGPVAARADGVRDAQQWVLDAVWAPRAWAASEGEGVTVAVLDSGVNTAVSDLAGSVTTGPDFTHTDTAPGNPHWGEHGTWMASLIAGHGHDGGGSGILGIAPRAKILSLRVITDRDDPAYPHYQHERPDEIQRSLASAIRYAVRQHAAVISMSIGYSAPSTVVRAALQYATDHGTVVVASSGNSGDSSFARSHSYAPYSFPADYPGVLAVGAAERNGARAVFSSDNLSVQVVAPGVDVPAQGRDGQYWQVSGTSPACALVAGVIALIKARYPNLPVALTDEAVVSSTRDRPAGGYDGSVGFGMVDAAAALAKAKTLSADLLVAPSPGDVLGAGEHYGGGTSRIAGPPVRPRGTWPLVGFGLLGGTSLALIAAAVARITHARRQSSDAPAGWSSMAGASPPVEVSSSEVSSSAEGPACAEACCSGGVPPPVAAPGEPD